MVMKSKMRKFKMRNTMIEQFRLHRNCMKTRGIYPLFTIIFALLLGAGMCFASGWERTYGGTENENANSVVQTTDGGYIIAGNTNSFGVGFTDMYLVKTTATGDTDWTRTYGGSDYDVAHSVAQTTDGGYIIAGYSGPYDYHNVYIVKTTSTGDVQWTKTYGGGQNDEAYSVIQTTDGGYFVAGYSESFDEGAWGDVYALKLTSSGDTVWTRTYGGIDVDIAYSAGQTSDGGYILAGYTQSFGEGNIYLIKIMASGDIEWSQNYTGDVAYSVAQTPDGEYIVAGWIDYADYDIYTIKITSTGDTEWTKIYGGTDEEEASSVINTVDGGFLVVGYTMSFGAGEEDVYILKLNSSGDTVWTRTYGGDSDDEAYSVAQTTDGGYIIAGYTDSFGADGGDMYLIKTDSLGFATINEPAVQKPVALSINAYPNPFNSSVAITVSDGRDLARQTPTNIAIYDIRGNVVWERSPDRDNRHREMSPTSRTLIYTPAQTNASGLYLVRATMSNGQIATRKILYMK